MALAVLGARRGPLVRKSRRAAAGELVIVGIAAATLAYGVGAGAASLLG